VNELVTIITTPHSGYDLLLRFLKYYESFNFPYPILVLDSNNITLESAELKKLLLNQQVRHIKYPHDLGFNEKISQGTAEIATPFAALCCEDDFITTAGLTKAAEFLSRNPDYAIAHGQYKTFWARENEFVMKDIPVFPSIDDDNPGRRFYQYLSKPITPVFNALARTDTLRLIWQENMRCSNDLRFGELLPAGLSLIHGKMKYLEVFYAARRGNVLSTGQSIHTYLHYIADGTFGAKYDKFRECVIKHLSPSGGGDAVKAGRLVDKAMDNYLRFKFGHGLTILEWKAKISRNRTAAKVYVWLKNIYRFIRPSAPVEPVWNRLKDSTPGFTNPAAEGRQDFLTIKELVLKYPCQN
jgi:glycosyltransferase domain-containing protein